MATWESSYFALITTFILKFSYPLLSCLYGVSLGYPFVTDERSLWYYFPPSES